MYERKHEWQNWQKMVVWVLAIFIVIAGSIATFRFATRVVSPMPKDIREKLTFSPLVVPSNSKTFTTDNYRFASAENNIQILTYRIHGKDGAAVSMSEYEQPTQFTEIPEYKDRFLTNVAKQYDTVTTSSGTLYLGRMTKNANKQLAVMLEKGLIVFLAPDNDLDKNQWRKIGDALDIEKVTD